MKQCLVLVIALFGAGTYFVPNKKKKNALNISTTKPKNIVEEKRTLPILFYCSAKSHKNEEYKIVIVFFYRFQNMVSGQFSTKKL